MLCCVILEMQEEKVEKTILFWFIKKYFLKIHEFFLLSSSLYLSSSNELFWEVIFLWPQVFRLFLANLNVDLENEQSLKKEKEILT